MVKQYEYFVGLDVSCSIRAVQPIFRLRWGSVHPLIQSTLLQYQIPPLCSSRGTRLNRGTCLDQSPLDESAAIVIANPKENITINFLGEATTSSTPETVINSSIQE